MLENTVYQRAEGFCTPGSTATYAEQGALGSGVITVRGAIPSNVIELIYLLAVDAMPEIGYPGRTLGGFMPNTKNCTDLNLVDPEVWVGDWSPSKLMEVGYDIDALDSAVSKGLTEALSIYRGLNAPLSDVDMVDTGYQMQRYEKGSGFYAVHTDASPADGSDRVLGCVIYLNDVADGGQTHLTTHDIYIKPEAGKILLFPAYFTHPHESMIPHSDDKYIISTFIVGLPPPHMREHHDGH